MKFSNWLYVFLYKHLGRKTAMWYMSTCSLKIVPCVKSKKALNDMVKSDSMPPGLTGDYRTKAMRDSRVAAWRFLVQCKKDIETVRPLTDVALRKFKIATSIITSDGQLDIESENIYLTELLKLDMIYPAHSVFEDMIASDINGFVCEADINYLRTIKETREWLWKIITETGRRAGTYDPELAIFANVNKAKDKDLL